MNKSKIDRRAFLRASTIAGGGLMLGLYAPEPAQSQSGSSTAAIQPGITPDDQLRPTDFITINPRGEVTIASRNPEHGQGIHNMLAMLVAEELDVEWKNVRIQRAACDNKYGTQFTGGSIGTPSNWEPMRRIGGAARAMLIEAAARQWGVIASECSTQPGRVVHTGSGRTAGYGELAVAAAALPPPALKSVRLKDPKDYRIIGQTTSGDENRAIVTGKPIYGIDVTVPGMLYAIYQRSPVYGGRPISANLDVVRKLKGVRHAFIVEGQPAPREYVNYLTQDHGLEPGIAIVADNWWAAQSAREKLEVRWDEGVGATQNSVDFAKQAAVISAQVPARTLRKDGDVEAAFSRTDVKTVESSYTFPFIAHAPLEPQNCTAHYHDGKLEVWSTSQTPQIGRGMLARLLNIPESNINIHMRRGGGGFGRRLYNDYMCEAAWISRTIGAPVKVLWTREDDMQHDYYRSGGFQFLKASVDSAGRIVSWRNHFIGYGEGETFTHTGQIDGNEFPSRFIPNFLMQSTVMPLGLKTGALRAPRSNVYAWVFQSFIDELAHAAGRDPVDFRLELLSRGPAAGTPGVMDAGRMAAVVRLAAERSGWGKRQLAKGTGMGIGFHFSHRGYFAEVAEVTIIAGLAGKKIRVNRVWVAGDVGSQIINPGAAENLTQGAVVDGMSEMLQEISLAKGRVVQSNFHDHPLVRMSQVPPIEVHYLKSPHPPTGLGEPALPPILPAISNAIFAATGDRLRNLPITREGYSFA